MSWNGVITNAGRALLDQLALGGHVLTITGATVGSGYVAEANMRSATALNSQKDNASIVSAEIISDGTRFKVQVGPTSGTAYTAHEVGLWARLDDADPVLFSLHQDPDGGVGVPTAAESPDFAFALYLIHAISNTESLEVNISPTVYVSNSTFTEEKAVQDRRHLRYKDATTPDWDAYDPGDDTQITNSFWRSFYNIARDIAPGMMVEGQKAYEECVLELETEYNLRFVGTCSIKVYQDSYRGSTRWFTEIIWSLTGGAPGDLYRRAYFGRFSGHFEADIEEGLDNPDLVYRRLAQRIEKTGTLTGINGVTVGADPVVRQSGNVCTIQAWITFTDISSRGLMYYAGVDRPGNTTVYGTYTSYPSKTTGLAMIRYSDYEIGMYDIIPQGDTSAFISITYIAN